MRALSYSKVRAVSHPLSLFPAVLLTAGTLALMPGAWSQASPPDGKIPAVRHHRPVQPFFPSGSTKLGDPLIGLTGQQLTDFTTGQTRFQEVETPESGLGPVYNNVSCVACHFSGAIGGAGVVTVTRIGEMVNGQFDPLTQLGGTLIHSTAIAPEVQENIPAPANVIAHREATPLFGLGLIEAISDKDILAQTLIPKPDGIQGRASMITDVVSGQLRVGRFGWKAQQATLLAFAGDAYRNEMGITNRYFPTEVAPNGNAALLAIYDKVADPEDTPDPITGKADIDTFADFMRYLAPPPRLQLTPTAAVGENLFRQLNCVVCHQPSLDTDVNPVPALNKQKVWLYSDLLLHDMGLLGDGIQQADAQIHEMRTPPLWGLRFSGPYLHDGRAATIDEAIRGHDGEARISRDRYLNLTPVQQSELLEFLKTL